MQLRVITRYSTNGRLKGWLLCWLLLGVVQRRWWWHAATAYRLTVAKLLRI